MSLEDALKVVRAAGYQVSKPQPRRQKKTRVGPTCVVRFGDGGEYRMTTYCDDEQPDYDHGLKLCQEAWRSRHKIGWSAHHHTFFPVEGWTGNTSPPPVASIHFERDGIIIGEQ